MVSALTVGTLMQPLYMSPLIDAGSQCIDIGPHALVGYGIVFLPSGTPIEKRPWVLRRDVLAEVRYEQDTFVAVCHDVGEYGTGATVTEAIHDLLTSLVDYRASLEKRANRLADAEKQHLDSLRALF